MPAQHIDSRFCRCKACRPATTPALASKEAFPLRGRDQECHARVEASQDSIARMCPATEESIQGLDPERAGTSEPTWAPASVSLRIPEDQVVGDGELDDAIAEVEVALGSLTAERERATVRQPLPSSLPHPPCRFNPHAPVGSAHSQVPFQAGHHRDAPTALPAQAASAGGWLTTSHARQQSRTFARTALRLAAEAARAAGSSDGRSRGRSDARFRNRQAAVPREESSRDEGVGRSREEGAGRCGGDRTDAISWWTLNPKP